MAKSLSASDISVVALSPHSAVSPFDCRPPLAVDHNDSNDSGTWDPYDDEDSCD
jgi:hypothetical protein